MFCSKCAAENPYDANFCYKCAFPLTANFTVSNARQVQPLEEEQQTVVKPSPVIAPPSPAPAAKKTDVGLLASKIIVSVGLAGLAAVVVVIALPFLIENLRAPTNSNKSVTPINTSIPTNNWIPASSTPAVRQGLQQKTTPSNYITNSSEASAAIALNNCPISSNSATVNARIDCDVRDCDNDAGTITGTIPNGTAAALTETESVSSSNGFDWVEIDTSRGTFWVASSKLGCYQGE